MKFKFAFLGIVGIAAIGTFDARDRLLAQATRSVWDGIYTAEQAKRGEPLYQSQCSGCHGPDLTGQDAPGLVGGGFNANWSGLSIGDLFERIRKSMPQNDPGSLTRHEYTDILSFVLLKNNFPAGETELTGDAAVLNQIKFEPTKP